MTAPDIITPIGVNPVVLPAWGDTFNLPGDGSGGRTQNMRLMARAGFIRWLEQQQEEEEEAYTRSFASVPSPDNNG